jgi:uncharacterized protein (DUF3820 family)
VFQGDVCLELASKVLLFFADRNPPLVTLDRLMALVQEVELAETKMALLNTISVVVERLEHNVSHQSPSAYILPFGIIVEANSLKIYDTWNCG